VQQLPESVKTLWRVGGVFTGLLLGVIAGGALVALQVALDAPSPLYAVPVVLLFVIVGLSIWWAGVRYRNWGWQITEGWIEAKHGVIGRHRIVIPRNRIQTVTTNSGPVDRILDLETITVHTAGAGAPNLTIPHLSTATVARIRDELGHGVHD
jgi:membrane protein YdbS with pleckstrin-like domain